MSDGIDLVIATRLWRLYRNEWADDLRKGLTAKSILVHPPQPEFREDAPRWFDTPEERLWDLGRIRYFYDQIKAGQKIDPIDVDNQCSHGRVHPVPIVLDGHHRLIAAVVARARIPVSYGGRVDLLDYLTGKRRHPPV